MRYMLSYYCNGNSGLSANRTFDTLEELERWGKETGIVRGGVWTMPDVPEYPTGVYPLTFVRDWHLEQKLKGN
jgi:hypothetical protein